MSSPIRLFCGEIWHAKSSSELLVHKTGALALDDQGKIIACGEAKELKAKYKGATLEAVPLIIPGFVDTHIHFPQMDMIGAVGENLLKWLERYTFPIEAAFSKKEVAEEAAPRFVTELLANGTTTSCVYSSSHRVATEILFKECLKRGVRAVIGKTCMDRDVPANLQGSSKQEIADSEALLRDWHGKDSRLFYAITPRYAVSCSEELMIGLGALHLRHPGSYVQTHYSESADEMARIKSLFPADADYLSVYERMGLLGSKTVLAHGVHPSKSEISRLQQLRVGISHCPTSNLFMGSGLFPLDDLSTERIPIGLGTDVGGGTSFSLFQTMNEAYKVQALRGRKVDPVQLFFLATLGGATVLSLQDSIGNFDVGKEADFQIIQPTRSRLLKKRWEQNASARDRLSALIHLGDDRVVERVFVRGKLVHQA